MAKQEGTQQKRVNFDFFQVWIKGKDGEKIFDLDDWIERLPEKPLDKRNIRYNGDIIRCDKTAVLHEENEPVSILHFTRLRNSTAPAVATLSLPDLIDVDLKADEYIAEDVSALFDYRNSVLMIQKNIFSLSISALAKYVNYFWNVGNSEDDMELIEFLPVLRKDAFKLGLSAKRINKFSFKTANRQRGSMKPFQGGLASAISALEAYDGVSIEVTISTTRSKDSVLDQHAVYESIKTIQQRQTDFKRAMVTSGDSGVSVPIELIDSRLTTFRMFNVPMKAYLDQETVQQDMDEIYSPIYSNFKKTVDENLEKITK
jgi:hypothetical protein